VVCPTCGAADQTTPACRRCRSDLRLLLRLEADRSAEMQALARALAAGRWSEALVSAQYIHTLRQDDISFRLLGVCQLLSGQIADASATYRQHGSVSGR
jgi:hypothetical protein